MSSRAPLLPETHCRVDTPSPPRLEYPFITGFLAAHQGAAQTRDQGSGVGKERGSHPSTAAGSGPADSPIHPDHSRWNCSSNAMAGGSGPSTEFYSSLPLTQDGPRCPTRTAHCCLACGEWVGGRWVGSVNRPSHAQVSGFPGYPVHLPSPFRRVPQHLPLGRPQILRPFHQDHPVLPIRPFHDHP
jgi:hypothetical protein